MARAKGIVFDKSDAGTHIDGAYGEEHALRKMMALLHLVSDELPEGDATGAEADDLAKEIEGLEPDSEDAQELLDDGTEILQRVTEDRDNLTWLWDAGDLLLTQETGE